MGFAIGPLDLSLFVLLAALRGSAFFFLKLSVIQVNPYTITFLRLFIGWACLGLALLALLLKDFSFITEVKKLGEKKMAAKLFFMGLMNNMLPVTFIALGEDYTNSSVASIIIASTPIFTAIIGSFFLKDERIGKLKALAFFIGLLGLILVSLQGLVGGGNSLDKTSWTLILLGHLLIICTAFSYGIGAIFVRKYIVIHPVVGAFGQVCSGMILSFPVALAIDVHFHDFHKIIEATYVAWVGIFYQGIGATCIGILLYYILMQRIGAYKLMSAWFLFPVFGILEGVLLLQEWKDTTLSFKLLEVIGAAVIILSLVIIMFEKGQKNKKPAPTESRKNEKTPLIGGSITVQDGDIHKIFTNNINEKV